MGRFSAGVAPPCAGAAVVKPRPSLVGDGSPEFPPGPRSLAARRGASRTPRLPARPGHRGLRRRGHLSRSAKISLIFFFTPHRLLKGHLLLVREKGFSALGANIKIKNSTCNNPQEKPIQETREKEINGLAERGEPGRVLLE